MGCFDSAGSKSVSSTETKTPEQKQWLSKVLETYGPYIGQGAFVYPGERVAGFTPTQEESLAGAQPFLDYFGSDLGTMPLFGQTGEALSGIMSGETGAAPITPQQTADYFKSVYQAPAMKGWEETIRPAIREAYAGPGFWGQPRAKAEMEGIQDIGDWLGEQRGGLEWNVLQSNRAIEEAKAQRALGAVPLGMGYAQLPTQEAGARLAGRQGVFGFADVGRAQQQAEINAAMQKYAEGQQLTDPEIISIVMAALDMNFTSSSYSSSRWGPGLGYVGAGSALEAMGGQMGGALGGSLGGKYLTF